MGLFEKKSKVSRMELRKKLGRAEGRGKFSRQQRQRLESEVFIRKPGGSISKQDYSKALKDLKKAEYKARNYREKLEIERKIKFLEDLEKAA